ncbi:glutamate 5-kinase [uncultured Treponema sp.]|uniref:glutamate 5-kinase n=1 Tax=uncultured Treponema sp. TaxID=162155 RepID=UPI0027D9C792|nr:glutamate 5-kinase [uncultured Treponema sp.]
MTIKEAIDGARKIVLKIGSNTLVHSDGSINTEFLTRFADDCAGLIKKGKQLIIVSSGAQVTGLATISGWAHKRDVHYRQALCAIGQVELMDRWRLAFRDHNIHVAQLLLTKDDFEDDHRTLNIRNTMFTLVDENVIPIINENDTIAIDEIRIGDNDNLSALTSILWSADLLILFSDIDGVYTDNPKTNPHAKLIEEVKNIKELRSSITVGATNSFGTGGIETKIEAAEKTTASGIPMVIANGSRPAILSSLAEGRAAGTLFTTDDTSLFKIITGNDKTY